LKRLDYRVKEWDNDFQELLTSLRAKKHVILSGDLNVCH
jgi:exonuclease III